MNSAKAIHRIANLLPGGFTRGLATPLSGLAYLIHEQSRHRLEIHEAIASALELPVESQEVDRMVKSNLRHMLQVIFEVARFDRLKQDWNRQVRVEGMEHYRAVQKRGQGVVLFSGHVGNWELLISGLSLLGIDKPYALGWKQPPSAFNDLLDHQRVLWGTQILWAQDFSEEQVATILGQGGTLFMMCDHFEQGKTKVNLFGHPTGTPAGPVLFARKYQAALMPIHTYRDGSVHQVIIEPSVELISPPGGDLTPDLQTCMSTIERWIRQYPEQWVWIFKRGEWRLNHQEK
jgi:KDO2-lipid IV(A) lauroyltransferase